MSGCRSRLPRLRPAAGRRAPGRRRRSTWPDPEACTARCRMAATRAALAGGGKTRTDARPRRHSMVMTAVVLGSGCWVLGSRGAWFNVRGSRLRTPALCAPNPAPSTKHPEPEIQKEAWCRTSRPDTMKMTSSAIFVAWSPIRSRCREIRIKSRAGSMVDGS
jgi:hypothetical protein